MDTVAPDMMDEMSCKFGYVFVDEYQATIRPQRASPPAIVGMLTVLGNDARDVVSVLCGGVLSTYCKDSVSRPAN